MEGGREGGRGRDEGGEEGKGEGREGGSGGGRVGGREGSTSLAGYYSATALAFQMHHCRCWCCCQLLIGPPVAYRSR